MSFKDQLLQDIREVFLNPDEFGESHVINGVPLFCIVDESMDGLTGPRADGFANSSMIGLDEQTRVIHLEDSALSPRPVPGQTLDIDGESWTVLPDANAVTLALGLLILKVSRAFS